MAKGRTIINSFNAGEISVLMEGRTDFPRYNSSAKTLENWIIHTQGGITRRWGTRFVKACKVNTATRLIPFVVDGVTWYVLEFGVDYIRVHRPTNSAPNDTAVDVSTALSLYTANQLFEVQYAQTADVLYLVHPDHPVRKLTRLDSLGASWTIVDTTFAPPPTFEKAKHPTDSIALSAITGTGIKIYSGATYFLAADVDSVIQHGAGRAVITAVDVGGKSVTADVLEAFAAERIVAGVGTVSGAVTTITTSINHGLTTGANAGDLIVVTSGAQSGQVRRIESISGVNTIVIDAAFPGDPGGASWDRGVRVLGGSTSWSITGSPATKLTSDKTSPVRGIATLTLTDAGWRAGDVGKYVRAMGGTMKITSFTSSTVVKAEILAILSSAPSTAPFECLSGTWTMEEESWTAANGYPATVSFYEQRLFFGGTTEQPQTLWGSATADYENFAMGVLATDAVSYTIASNEINLLRWMSPSRVLLIGALAREFRASGGSSAITPSNIDIRGETPHGSLRRTPVQIGHTTIFIQAAARKLREMVYNFDTDSYKADDFTVLNPDISVGGFNQIAYSQEPYSILYAVRNDGQLCALTYEKAQEVMGWGRIVTDGLFEAVAILPPFSGEAEQNIYVVVNRDGTRLIERFDPDLSTDSAVEAITGLSHLNGQTVTVIGDGRLLDSEVVAGGVVAPSASCAAYEVGLPFVATAVTARPEIMVNGQSSQAKPKKWSSVFVRVQDTTGIKINGNRSWIDGVPKEYQASAPTPESGDVPCELLGIDSDGRLTIVADLPFPATILMVVGELSVGD